MSIAYQKLAAKMDRYIGVLEANKGHRPARISLNPSQMKTLYTEQRKHVEPGSPSPLPAYRGVPCVEYRA